MKRLLALILLLLILFTSCQKADSEKDDTNEVSTIEQKKPLEITDKKTELEPIAEVEPKLVVEIEPVPKPQIKGVINDTQVRLRSEQNLESETLDYLNTGDSLIILDKSAEDQQIDDMEAPWYKVQTKEYSVGWVYGAFVDTEREIVQSDFPTIEEWAIANGFYYNERSNGLYNRQGALSPISESLDFSIFTTIPQTELVKINYLGLDARMFYNEDYSLFENLDYVTIEGPDEVTLNGLGDTPVKILSIGTIWNASVVTSEEFEYLDNLEELTLVNVSIPSLEELKYLINLKNFKIEDMDPSIIKTVSYLVTLEEIDIRSSVPFEIPDMSKLENLKTIGFFYEGLTDLTGVESIPNPFEFWVWPGRSSAGKRLTMPNLSFDALLDSKIETLTFYEPDFKNYAERANAFAIEMKKRNPDFRIWMEG